MALTLAQLLAPQTVDQWRSILLAALQGLGVVVKTGTGAGGVGTGTGSISLSGTPAAAYSKIIINITTAGELGTAVFQYSLNGGTSYVSGITVPATTGIYVLGATGVTVTFASGISGSGTSFQISDSYSFALQVPSLPVTAWQASGAYRQLVEIEAQALASLSAQQSAIAASGLTTQATGSWADLIANYFYQLTRNAAGVTKGLITLSDAAGAGPFTITTGTMWFASSNGLLYSNSTGGTLARNGTLQLTVQAGSPGAAYNVGNNAIVSIVAGTLPGVIGTGVGGAFNPDPGTGTWVTSQGADAETDSALMLRCQQRWSTLGSGSPAAAYQLWATLAEAAAGHATTITRVLAYADTTTPGQVDVYLAGTSGGVGGSAVTDATTYITPFIPLTATANIQSAANVAITVAGTVYFFVSKTTSTLAQAAVAAALAVYINGLSIGSDAGGVNVKAYYSELEGAVADPLGTSLSSQLIIRNIVGFTVNGGTSDVGLTTGQVATLTNSLTFVGV